MARWSGLIAIGLLVLAIGTAATATTGDAGPCAATPGVAASYVYGTAPVVLIGAGSTTTTLSVTRLPTDRYGAITVASASDTPFALTITSPDGDKRPVFSAESPDALTGALLLDRIGNYTITVEATGFWSIVIR